MKLFIFCVAIIGAAHAAVLLPPICGCMPGSPVCGSDFKTYSSECQMKCDNRYNVNPPVVIYRGRCEDLIGVQPDQYNPNPFDPYTPYNPNPYNPNPYNPYGPYNPYAPCNPEDLYNPCPINPLLQSN